MTLYGIEVITKYSKDLLKKKTNNKYTYTYKYKIYIPIIIIIITCPILFLSILKRNDGKRNPCDGSNIFTGLSCSSALNKMCIILVYCVLPRGLTRLLSVFNIIPTYRHIMFYVSTIDSPFLWQLCDLNVL